MNTNFNISIPKIIEQEIGFSGKDKKVNVRLLNQDGKIVTISAKAIDPYKGFFGFFHSLTEKKFIAIKLNKDSPPLYIKINSLQKILNPEQIEQLKKGETVDVINIHETRKKDIQEQVKLVQKIANDKGISQEKLDSNQEKFLDLFNKLGFKAIDKIKELLDEMEEEEITAFKFINEGIPVEKGGLAKARGDLLLKDFVAGTNVEKAKNEMVSSQSSKKQELMLKGEEDKLFDLAAKLGIEKEEADFLHTLEKRVPFDSLNEKLESIKSDKEKKTMLRTFIEIGKELKSMKSEEKGIFIWLKKMILGPSDQMKYVKKIKNQEGIRTSHAFAIDQKHIYIIPKEDPIGQGASKVVSNAFDLMGDPSAPIVRLKVKGAFSSTIYEQNLLEKIHNGSKKPGKKSCLMPVYLCRVFSQSTSKKPSKYVLFQKKLDGDGIQLYKASPAQQVRALRDVGNGLAELHADGHVHMDMKPENFLLQGKVVDKKPVEGVVADFGKTQETGKVIKGGSLGYLPREAIEEVSDPSSKDGVKLQFRSHVLADPAIDSFSYGATILDILTNGEYYNKPGYVEVFGLMDNSKLEEIIDREIQRTNDSKDTPQNKNLKIGMLDIARQLMKEKPEDRISCQDAAYKLDQIIQVDDQRKP